MATHQLTLVTIKEVVRCEACNVGLSTLAEMRELSCNAGQEHQVSRLEYFRLYRLSVSMSPGGEE